MEPMIISHLQLLLAEAQSSPRLLRHNVTSLISKCDSLRRMLSTIATGPQSQQNCALSEVPLEIAEYIFAWLHPAEALKFRRLAKAFNNLLVSQEFATLLLSRFLPKDNLSSKRHHDECAKIFFAWPSTYQKRFATSHLSASCSRKSLLWSHKATPFETNHIPQGSLFAMFPNLVELDLSYCALSGTIPDTLFTNMRQLQSLKLHENRLTGEISAAIAACTQLRVLNLHSNHFSGKIPESLYTLSELQYCNLGHNRLQGVLSPKISCLQKLNALYLNDNHLEGEIPKSMAELEGLEYLVLSCNRFVGRVPTELLNLRRAVYFNFEGNGFDAESNV
ncbi:hypothetical protein CcCBS67573_g00146 [Chytriomyces confervae]|uniref:F-box domain-containing protein n=1 Tax=Chytriomyces confervae TaxID=246404 RepID=A0A507FU90_9FUNG|nr:hypothetical protein HDU80_011112 [Chytriomyces hyalinus]TPX78606.1 hypothetical protein CcCBS67573_g00146 [Chytriomyces confervae]